MRYLDIYTKQCSVCIETHNQSVRFILWYHPTTSVLFKQISFTFILKYIFVESERTPITHVGDTRQWERKNANNKINLIYRKNYLVQNKWNSNNSVSSFSHLYISHSPSLYCFSWCVNLVCNIKMCSFQCICVYASMWQIWKKGSIYQYIVDFVFVLCSKMSQ